MLFNFIQRIITAIVLISLFLLFIFLLPPIYFSMALGAILGIILFSEWPRFKISGLRYWLLTPLYPCMPFACLIYLNQINTMYMVLIFGLVALFDSGSHIIGSLFGRHRIAPMISPKKSWEGAIGGYICTLAIAWMIIYVRLATMLSLAAIINITLICILAFFGDLFESALKRRAGIKDSGSLLPGHGGLLDRFDGVMFVAVYFACRTLF